MKLKVLVIILIVLFVLFAVGLGMGGCRRGGVKDDPPGWTKTLGKPMRKPTLGAQDVASATPPACKSQFRDGRIVLNQGEACVLMIAESPGRLLAASVRTLPLKLTRGDSATILVDPKEPDRFDTEHDLPKATQTPEPQIFRQGGRVTITCVRASDQCWIEPLPTKAATP